MINIVQAPSAPDRCDLDHSLISAVYQDIENGDADLFDDCFDAALTKLTEILSTDCYDFE